MKHLFEYNWQVRDEWFERCRTLSHEVLLQERQGGVGSILETLFHIVDVEYSWIRAMKGLPDLAPHFEDYKSLEQVKALSENYRQDIIAMIDAWDNEWTYKPVQASWMEGTFYCGEVIRHLIAHEIHHVGQLSVWARELGLEPVSASFIERDLMQKD
ncbi:DinB family protein [Caldalkalibacillus salinus]|uniref:DinB family protein n=1 Tax=Caldalkalibacillus salinus TaxID=2803787 RepID=UPI0019217A6E|nr:DinB family protein [Caldalkalibacillus salinus]